jgi:hypothetical protein
VSLPTRIVADEFEKLKTELYKFKEIDLTFNYKYGENLIELKNIMEYCYELDENEKPARYRLKYLNRLFPTINHKESEFDKLWNKLEKKLGDVLRKAAQICFDNKLITKTEYERYFVSVTEKEIFNGILKGKDLKNNVLFFEREIEDIEQQLQKNADKSVLSKYIELDKSSNIEMSSKKLLEDLKYKKIPEKLPSSNIFNFKVKWAHDGITLATHSDYIQNFGETFFEKVKDLIIRNRKKQISFDVLNEQDAILIQEVLDHANFCVDTVSKFHGREDLLDKVI